MNRIAVWILRAPWWGYILLAGLVAYGGESIYQRKAERHELRVEAAMGQAPQPVDLSTFTQNDITAAEEVHIEGWINPDLNTHLIQSRNFIRTGEAYVMVMFGRKDGPDADVARAAIKMTEAQKGKFREVMERSVVDFDQGRLIFAVNGLRITPSSFHSHLKDVLKEKGVRLGPDFVWVTPFVDGREAGLTDDGELIAWRGGYAVATAMLLLTSVIKFHLLRKRKRRKDRFAESPVSSGAAGLEHSSSRLSGILPDPSAITSGTEMPKDLISSHSFSAPRAEAISDDSPLGRMQRRDQKMRDFMTATQAPAEERSFQPRASNVSIEGLSFSAPTTNGKANILSKVGYIVAICIGLIVVFGGGANIGTANLASADDVGIFVQIQQMSDNFLGTKVNFVLGVLLFMFVMFLLWAFVIRRFFQSVGRGVDKAAAASVKAKMKSDPFEKLGAENASPIQSSR